MTIMSKKIILEMIIKKNNLKIKFISIQKIKMIKMNIKNYKITKQKIIMNNRKNIIKNNKKRKRIKIIKYD